MDTFQAITSRTSVREYTDKAVPRPLLEKLVDAGRMAPSARAVEPWEFVVITDRAKIDKIAAIAPNGKFLDSAQAAIIVICAETKYFIEDGCAATENILLQAVDLGLGACWVAGDKKPYAEKVLMMFNAPAGTKLVSIISIGWPKQKPSHRRNRPLKDVLHWEGF